MSTETAEAVKKPTELMGAVTKIVTLLEPLDNPKRAQVLAAVMCLESIEAATAAVHAFQRAMR